MIKTWIISWLFTATLLAGYTFIAFGLHVDLLLTAFEYTFIFGLPAFIALSLYWLFLKRKVYTKKQVLTRNIIATAIIGLLCALLSFSIITHEQITDLLYTFWPVIICPMIGGPLAVWLNQNEIYKNIQAHFINPEIRSTSLLRGGRGVSTRNDQSQNKRQ